VVLTVLFLFGLVTAKLSHLASQGAEVLYAEAGKYPLFGLVHTCITLEDKERQLCEPHKVVTTCGPFRIRNSGA
jgi:hypothetical protein